MLPDKAVTEFIEIFEKEHGIKLTREQGDLLAIKVLNLFKYILRVANLESPEGGEKQWHLH